MLAADPRLSAYSLLMFIGMLGLLGLLMVAGLMMAWRRYNRRQESRRPREEMPDLWQESGRRLIDRIDRAHDQASRRPPRETDPLTDWTDQLQPPDSGNPDDDPDPDDNPPEEPPPPEPPESPEEPPEPPKNRPGRPG